MNNQNLTATPIRSTEEAVNKGRAGGIASGKARRAKAQRMKDLFAAFGVEPIAAETIKQADAVLLAMTNEQLKAVAENAKMPTYMRRRARLLLQPDDDKAFDVSEKLIDRVAGKPKQQVEADVKQPPILQVIDIGK